MQSVEEFIFGADDVEGAFSFLADGGQFFGDLVKRHSLVFAGVDFLLGLQHAVAVAIAAVGELEAVLGKAALYVSGADAHHGNAALFQFHAEAIAKHIDGGFGAAIHVAVGERKECARGADTHDFAAALHSGQECAGKKEHRKVVDLEHVAKFVLGQKLGCARNSQSGVVHEQIDVRIFGHDRRSGALYLRSVREVAREKASILRKLVLLWFRAADAHAKIPAFAQILTQGIADAATCAGNDGDFLFHAAIVAQKKQKRKAFKVQRLTKQRKSSKILPMVLSPLSLWKDYDRKVMPLSTTVVKEFSHATYTERYLYFNGEASARGCTRIFARFLQPSTPTDAILIAMVEPEKDVRDQDFSSFLQQGWAVLVCDYAGNAFNHERFTIYPHMLDFADYKEEALFLPTDSPFKSCWYIWATVAMRGVTFCEEYGFKKIALFGQGYGGAQMIKCACVCEEVCGGITLYSPGFFPETQNLDPALLAMRVGLNTAAYAPCLRAPLLMLCCSNDDDGSLDEISEFCNQSKGMSIYYAEPRTSHGETVRIRSNMEHFLAAMRNDTLQPGLFGAVRVTVAGAEDKLYFSLLQTVENPLDLYNDTKQNLQFSSATLYVSQGISNPAYRNWRAIPMQKADEDEFIAYTTVYSADKNVYAFVCADRDGFIVNTPVLDRIPSSLGVNATVSEKKRLLYESDMQIDDFFTSDQTVQPQMKNGPFDISGVAASSLNTYKIGSPVYSGEPDANLQVLLYSPSDQDIVISVIDSETYSTYSCTRHASPADDWLKLSLAAGDLKSKDGMLSGWDKAVFLHIEGENELLINTILWV